MTMRMDAAAIDLVRRLRSAGVRLTLADDKVVVRATRGAVDADTAALIRDSRDALVATLRAETFRQERIAEIPRVAADSAPLTHSQEQIWIAESFHPGIFTMAAAYPVPGEVNVSAFCRALRRLQQRHQMLRCRFESREAGPVQVASTVACHPHVIDLSALDNVGPAMRMVWATATAQPFDLTCAPLMRVALVRTGKGWVVLLALHHLVADGWSLRIVERELGQLYAEESTGVCPTDAAADSTSRDLFDFASWQRAWTAGPNREMHERHWLDVLDDLPLSLELPRRRSPAEIAWIAATVRAPLGTHLSTAIHAAAATCDVARFALLLAGWALMLSRLSGKQRFAVATPLAGRDLDSVQGAVGCFINTVAVRCEIDRHQSFSALARTINRNVLDAHDFQNLPPDAILAVRRPAGSVEPRRFETMLSLNVEQEVALPTDAQGGDAVVVGHSRIERDIAARVIDEGGRLDLVLDYAAELYDPALIESAVALFAAVLGAAAADPEASVGTIVDRASAAVAPPALRGPVVPAPSDDLAMLTDAALADAPDSIAVGCGRRMLSRAAFDDRSAELAACLAVRRIGPEKLVGLCLPRSLALPLAVYSIWRAGAGYAPIAADWPDARITGALDEAGVRLVLTDAATAPRLRALGRDVLVIDPDTGRPLDNGDERGTVAVAGRCSALGRNLAYVIFTSGTTGRPKAVAVERSSVANLFAGLGEMVPGTGLRQALSSPVIFDASVEELLGILRGFTLEVLREETVLDALLLGRDLHGRRIDILTCTPTQLELLLAHGPARRWLPGTVVVGGEAMSTALWRELAARPTRTLNSYGPTECTVDATWAVVAGDVVHIGTPMANLSAVVADSRMLPCLTGVEGELILSGSGVARGYLGRAGATADAFRPSRTGPSGARVYRTGDRALLIEHAGSLAIEARGRADRQVKLRGFRIETGDIETVLRAVPGVAGVVVAVIESDRDEPVLSAFVMSDASLNGSDPAAWRAACGAALPPYMIPSMFVVVDRLPLSGSGKLDRTALGALMPATTAVPLLASRDDVPAPETGIVGRILETIGQVLARSIMPGDQFFEIGGTSLAAIRASARLRTEFGCEITGAEIVGSSTLGDLAIAIERRIAALPIPSVTTIKETPLTTVMRGPASFGQQQLWILDQLGAGGAVYAIVTVLRLENNPDLIALSRSLAHIVARQGVLRTYYEQNEAGELEQVVETAKPLALPTIDLSSVLPHDLPRVTRQMMLAWRAMPFDLSRAPQFRAAVARVADDDDILFLNVHHIAFDGWSMQIFLMELQTLYPAYRDAGRGAIVDPLPELPIQYIDFAAAQRMLLQGAQLDRYVAYWRHRLAGLPPVLDLPADRPRPQRPSYRGTFVSRTLGEEIEARVNALARDLRTTPFTILISCYFVFLSKLSGRRDVVTGTPYANRATSEVEGIIGYFVNTVVVRADIDPDLSFLETAARIRDHLAQDFAHQDLPFEQMVNALKIERVIGASPIMQTLFTAEMVPQSATDEVTDSALKIRSYAEDKGEAEAKFDIAVGFEARNGGFQFGLSFSTDLFDDATGKGFADRLVHIVEMLLADPRVPVGRIAAVLPHDVVRIEGPEVPVDPTDLAGRFDRVAVDRPDAAMISCGRRHLSIASVDRRSGAIAGVLAALGVGPDVVVAVCVERSIALPVALLATWRAGGAYLPVDADLPDARIARTLEDARVTLIVTTPDLAPRFAALGLHTVLIDRDKATLIGEPRSADAALARASKQAVLPDNLAYVLFTSGSTGRPKGVAVTRANLANLLDAQWATGLYGAAGETRASLNSTTTFDVSLQQLGEMLRGGHLRVLTNAQRIDSRELDRQLRGYRLDLFECTPSQLMPLLADTRDASRLPQCLLVAGEALPAPLWRELAALAPQVRSINAYGPTEFTIYATAAIVEGERPLIGTPVGNCTAQILDPRLRPTAPGVSGELCLSGPNVVRGYAGRPDLTAEAFRPDPTGRPGSRLYRTGDIVKVHAPPTTAAAPPIEIIGRADQQMKLRGYRIEAGEIEAALRGHAAVRSAVVVLRDAPAGDRRLVAYVELADGMPADPTLSGLLGDVCRAALPGYMVPSLFQFVPRIPQTSSGKVDRKALPPIAWDVATSESEGVGTDTVLGGLLAIWSAMLGVPRVAPNDNFFDIGGSSLLAMRMSARLRDVLGLDIRATDVISTPTVAEFAARIAADDFPATMKIVPRSALKLDRDLESLRSAAAPPAVAATPTPQVVPPQLMSVVALPPGFVRLRDGNPKGPLALLPHTAGGGVDAYAQLAAAICPDIALEMIGIVSPSFDRAVPAPIPLAKAAKAMAAEIVRLAASRPLILIGWSYGGVLAHELAVRLDNAGIEIAALVLLDPHSRDTSDRIDALSATSALEHVLTDSGMAFNDAMQMRFAKGGPIESVLGDIFGLPADGEDVTALARTYRLIDVHLEALKGHRPKLFEGSALLVRATVPDHMLCDWSEMAETVEVVDMPVQHGDLIGPKAARDVAALIEARLPV